MRRALSYVLLGLGVFALALGLLLRFYTYPQLAKVPLDPDRTTVAEGDDITAMVFVDTGDRDVPEIRDGLSLTSTTYVSGDLRAPEVREGGDVAVWSEATRVLADNAPDVQPVSGSIRKLCLDRHTGQARVPCEDQYIRVEHDRDPAERADDIIEGERDRVQQPGYNFKLPFGTEQRTYPWYVLEIRDTVDLGFEAEDTVKGLDVYRFSYQVEPTVVESDMTVPGRLVDDEDEDTVEVDRYFEAERTMWIDPVTGAVIALEQSVKQELVRDGQDYGAGTTVFDGTLALNDETVETHVAEAEQNGSKLWFLTTLPTILWVAGTVLIVVAGLLLLGRAREDDQPRGRQGRSRASHSARVG
ncbi:DUF3068 domain-containing protein [Haloechinothrix sp. YIM 98757]|uniref:DUF3068 domain-containing protein n=1 Tax=Haloechinothrix aidingensis TaxID=2752311 RepID=A0A838AG55_9PSEU|nr:DUF3068 domain-containing protein [Haloechinothrix aidingensis]MBA0128088.1 DUF3068 domain-containing protein [Haloechinothrix aidingensis]